MNNCSHLWSTNAGKGGEAFFGPSDWSVMRVCCTKCDEQNQYSPEQWNSIQPKLKTEKPRKTTFTCSFCHQDNCDISHDCYG